MSQLAVFVIMPLVTIALAQMFDSRSTVDVELVTPAISPSCPSSWCLVNTLVAIPYLMWQRRRTLAAVPSA